MGAREEFFKAAGAEAFNFNRIHLLEEHLERYNASLQNGQEQFKNLALARNRAAHIRWKAIENLDKYLLEFESNISKHGAKVVWAPEASDALNEIKEILKRHKVKQLVKSKSSVSEEIGLAKHLAENGYTVTETDVADVVLKKTGDKPSHIILPAIHKSRKEIEKHFATATAEEGQETSIENIVETIAEDTHNKYFEAQAGITGCNFLVADPGSIALTENEGNIVFSSGVPSVHIVLATIDKIIPSLADLDTLWPLLSTYGTGQKITAYSTIIKGPRTAKDIDGPDEVYVVLVDNGRTDLLAKKEQRPALTCIKCGACANVCPVYKTIGGQAFGNSTPGPIGAVTEPHRNNFNEYKHLSYASTLCGKCDQVCPVNIDLHNLLVENRRENAENAKTGFIDGYLWKLVKNAMMSRKMMNKGETFKGIIIKSSYKKDWGDRREFPLLAKQSFNQLWREKNGEK